MNRQHQKQNPFSGGKDPLDDYLDKAESDLNEKRDEKPRIPRDNRVRRFLKVGLIIAAIFFLIRGIGNLPFAPFNSVFTTVTTSQPSADLLDRMGARMTEMGYGEFTHDQLRELRSDGLTATFISEVRGLGYEELTLDEARQLAAANVSSTFLAMMTELGYDLTIEDAVRLRRGGVTANYTSRVHDLGYTDVTMDQLIRLQRIGVTTNLIERLQSERDGEISMEEIIRYRISNQ